MSEIELQVQRIFSPCAKYTILNDNAEWKSCEEPSWPIPVITTTLPIIQPPIIPPTPHHKKHTTEDKTPTPQPSPPRQVPTPSPTPKIPIPPDQSEAKFVFAEMDITNPLIIGTAKDVGYLVLPTATGIGIKRFLGMATYAKLAVKLGSNVALKFANAALWGVTLGDLACLGIEFIYTTKYERDVMVRAKILWKEETRGISGFVLAAKDFFASSVMDREIPLEYCQRIEAEDQAAINSFKQFVGSALFKSAINNGGSLTPATAKIALERLFSTAEGREYWANITTALKIMGGDNLSTYEKTLCAINPNNLVVDEETVRALSILTIVDFGDGRNNFKLYEALTTAQKILSQQSIKG